MTKITDILDITALNDMREAGYIRQAKHPTLPLVSECYTKQTMFERAWTNETRICRGLIWNTETQEVVARPFAKFFNYGEPSCPEIAPHEWVKVWNKLDGSLGIAYNTPDGPAIATKNSFTSPQAVHATEILRTKYRDWGVPSWCTVLFEIVYPENRIVLNYGDTDDLFFLDAVNLKTGNTVRVPPFYMPFPEPELLGVGEFSHLIGHFENMNRDNAEGVVIHAIGRDLRVKVKQQHYLDLHKTIFGINKKHLWELLSKGQGVSEILRNLPEELHDWARPVLNDLCKKYQDLDLLILESWLVVQNNGWYLDRKKLAQKMSDSPKWLQKAIWLLVDKNQERYNQFLWKQVMPSGENG